LTGRREEATILRNLARGSHQTLRETEEILGNPAKYSLPVPLCAILTDPQSWGGQGWRGLKQSLQEVLTHRSDEVSVDLLFPPRLTKTQKPKIKRHHQEQEIRKQRRQDVLSPAWQNKGGSIREALDQLGIAYSTYQDYARGQVTRRSRKLDALEPYLDVKLPD
jgi:hypothetical protein